MRKTKKRILQTILTLGLVALGALGMIKLTESKPQIKKQTVEVPLLMVRTMEVRTASQAVVVKGEGTVKPLQEIDLVPQVDGKVVYIAPSLINGGQFKKGEILLGIEPEDYQLTVTFAQSKVKSAESLLRMAEEESEAAREEWFQLYMDNAGKGKEPPALVLKQPQLAAAKAKLAADNADLKKALLNLERTEIKAPFDGRVEKEDVDLGQYVRPGEKLATIFSTDSAEIAVPLEDESLQWFHVPGFTPGNGPGAKTTVRARIAGRERSWKGRVVRAEGKLDEQTRMIRVVLRVDDPYATKPPLAMGLFVTVEIEGHNIPDMAIIPRSALHQGNVVWVVDRDGQLHYRKVKVVRIDGERVQISSGLQTGEQVAVSPLKTVTDGMKVRPLPQKEADLS
ncbi:MAG: efflux RND transporter periplasmic adaptor subunit [Desulfobacteraceae bacterium]|nr:efflux RND transporter periplasmic adaptor subunit [Desulfobacterales bacterium]MBL6968009.1 efflux RND transporter periplasmic adaptor subunit [Desulfobacteraceae bacterium]MBL7101420.1 efflux RND transporter periplasmic adaptor subunit [Desulfobacteraceae bacterium]MBL7171541.1 efflux RND transporter periplasmic adaptor subunit [Desulfobacteraceae bacterium]